MMNVRIQAVKFEVNPRLKDFINAKMSKLHRFAEDAISADVTLREDKNDTKGDKVVTIKLAMPGDELIADFRSTTFEESLDQGIEALKKQLERYKSKSNR